MGFDPTEYTWKTLWFNSGDFTTVGTTHTLDTSLYSVIGKRPPGHAWEVWAVRADGASRVRLKTTSTSKSSFFWQSSESQSGTPTPIPGGQTWDGKLGIEILGTATAGHFSIMLGAKRTALECANRDK